MQTDDIQIVILESLDLEHSRELLELMAGADFTDASDGAEWLAGAVAGSLAAVGAFDPAGHLIGFARALGDGVSDCYIQDVVVHPQQRGKHIGRDMVQFLVRELQKRNIEWIGLIATPNRAEFYRRLGFEVLTDHTPMIFRGDAGENTKKI